MKVGIIGGGSIGLLIGYYLSFNHDVTLYVRRTTQKDCLNQHGIRLSGSKEISFVRGELLKRIGHEDLLFVCVKQTKIKEIISFLEHVPPSTDIIFLQNGMSHLDQVNRLIHPIWLGIVEHGAKRLNDHTVDHTGKGLIKIAPYKNVQRPIRPIHTYLHKGYFQIILQQDWQGMLYEKLLINAVINPLTSLFQIKNGDILNNEHITFLAKQLCAEAAMVLHLTDDEPWLKVKNIIKNTANNHSSMLVEKW